MGETVTPINSQPAGPINYQVNENVSFALNQLWEKTIPHGFKITGYDKSLWRLSFDVEVEIGPKVKEIKFLGDDTFYQGQEFLAADPKGSPLKFELPFWMVWHYGRTEFDVMVTYKDGTSKQLKLTLRR